MGTCILLAALLAAPEEIPLYQVQTTAGPVVKGSIELLSATGVLRLSEEKVLSGGEWVTLSQTTQPYPTLPTQPHLLLVNGDCLVGEIGAGDGDAIQFRPKIGDTIAETTLRFPLSSVAIIWRKTLPFDEQPSWVTAPRKRDFLQLKNGDVLTGALNKIDGKEWRLMIDKREQAVTAANVLALGFNTDLARVRPIRGVYYRVVLRNGSRLSCPTVTSDGKTLTLTTPFKETFTVPLSELIGLSVEQGKAVPLSSLKPTQFDYQSFDGETATWTADRTVRGQPLQVRTALGASTYDRGLGIPAGSTLTYSLAGKYARFDALIGMDITHGERGTAQVQLLLDGKVHEISRNGKLNIREGVLTLQVDVRGVKEMKLVIGRSDGGIVQAAVNVVEGRLFP